MIRAYFSVLLFFVLSQVIAQEFYLGVDLSYVNEMEDCGAVYKNESGTEMDPYEIFSTKGANLVRLRLWHNPQWTNYSNFDDVKASITRAKSKGMNVLLNFHYSDFWADPGRQWRPEAWEDVETDEILGDSLYNYTYNTLNKLYQEGLLPEMIQIGNETNGNILIKRGTEDLSSGSPNLYPIDWDRQSLLFNRALEAVANVEINLDVDIKTIIHIADPKSAKYWLENAFLKGLDTFDIIGLSYYPQWHDLGVREVGDFVTALKNQFNREVMIVETGYPWTSNGLDQAGNILNWDSRLFTYSNNFSIEIQRDFMVELSWLVKENGGLGVIYWEPAWVSTNCQNYWNTGSHYENATLFDFNNQIHSGADFLSFNYDQKPVALEDQLVTFIVNMTGIDTKDGVYVTGDFSGENWQFLLMNKASGNIYEYSTIIPGRSEGAYVYYNNDIWSDAYREVVPENCALKWGTHRLYWIKGEQVQFDFAWGSCDQIPNSTFPGAKEPEHVYLFPTVVAEELSIGGAVEIVGIEIFDLGGYKHQIIESRERRISVEHLPSGIKIIRLITDAGVYTFKFIKK